MSFYNHLGPREITWVLRSLLHGSLPHPVGRRPHLDSTGSDEVRRYFIENALYWQTELHVDAIATHAVHAIFEPDRPFLEDLSRARLPAVKR